MNKKAEEWGKKFESIKHTDDMEMLYQGEDISKLEKPKRFNWRALMLVVIILAVVFVIVGLVGTILSLKEDVVWFEDNKTVYCLTK